MALGRLGLEAPRIGVGGVAEPGVSDGCLAFSEAVDRTKAVADYGGAAAATPGAWLAAERTPSRCQVATQSSMAVADWTPLDLSVHGLGATSSGTRFSIYTYES